MAKCGIGLRSLRFRLGSTLLPAIRDTHARFARFLETRGESLKVEPVLAADAFEASATGSGCGMARSLAEAVHAMGSRPDAVLLAQYSLAPARQALRSLIELPVLAGPPHAAAKMRIVIMGTTG